MYSQTIRLTAIYVCLLIGDASFAQQNFNFTSLTTKNGLSSNKINAIQKDRYGLMWFGTEDGLNKFDGTNITVYRHKPDDSTSLSLNEILGLHEDKAGNLWIATGGGSLCRYNRQKNSFTTYPAYGGPHTIGSNVVQAVYSDHRGRIWIGQYSGVNLLNPRTNAIVELFEVPGKPFTKSTTCLFEDSQNRMWIGTAEGLFRYDEQTHAIISYLHSPDNHFGLLKNRINAIAEDKQHNIWFASNDGLFKLPAGQQQLLNYTADAKGATLLSNVVHTLTIDNENRLFLGTGSGLNILDLSSNILSKLTVDSRNIHSIAGNDINTIYIDAQGIYWMATVNGGLSIYDKNLKIFNLVHSNPLDPLGLPAPVVTSFAESNNGKVFVGTDGGGLSLFDPIANSFKRFPVQSSQKSVDGKIAVLSLKMTRSGQLLMGTYMHGLFAINPLNGSYTQYTAGKKAGDLNGNSIFCITEDSHGNIWVGTNGQGINVLDKNNVVVRRYTPYPSLPNDILIPVNAYIRDIAEDDDGNFWIATHGGGIAFLQSDIGKFTVYSASNSKLPDDKVQTLMKDVAGNIWAGTLGGGLAMVSKRDRKITVISEKNGLLNNNVYKILQDSKGWLWVSTNNGLSSYDPGSGKIFNYTAHNGVQQNNFYNSSGMKTSTGYLYFGGLEGFNYFIPENLKMNTNVPSILITDLKISNISVAPSEDGPIKENISIAKQIDLNYKQNFALSYVGLNYTAPQQNQYSYKLEGFDKDWNNAGSQTTAVYTNLDPGQYVFRVRGSNNDGVWNTEGTSIIVNVHPPFWRSNYAYLFYMFVFIGSIFFLRHRVIRRVNKKHRLEQEQSRMEQERKESQQLHELDQLKIKFLTNLSHEFRSPISLIIGPVEQLLTEFNTGKVAERLHLIRRNGQRLLHLVNQLLDFRKMEENELQLHLSEGELINFSKEVFESFKDLAETKNIVFTFDENLGSFHTKFDYDKIERILFNLLSNAFKFTLVGGHVSLQIKMAEQAPGDNRSWICFSVLDTGIGISSEKKKKIFDRFFQGPTDLSILNQGSGIGLSITKEFVTMQGGTIEVESVLGKGTTFNVLLPFETIVQETILTAPAGPVENTSFSMHKEPGDIEAAHSLPAAQKPTDSVSPLVNGTVLKTSIAANEWEQMPLVLLVEDNNDFRFYLKDNLTSKFNVLEAENGKEGWQKALAEHPQLIISDISMPYMDGIELCRKIKSDKRTSHIPVILLTAAAGEEAQLKGLETGANDYITKPFSIEVLNAKIKNLLILNESFKKAYTKKIQVITPEVQLESADEKLLQQVMKYIEDNLTDTQLSVENLSRSVGMSRSSLYIKLLELTGETPVEYIRSVKINKAAVLLQKSSLQIAQIAYSVGFSTPNYFTKAFKVKFGMLPSEYRNSFLKQAQNL